MAEITSTPAPSFIERNPATTEAEAISTYETALGKTLQPAQPERLLVSGQAYREVLLKTQVQIAAEQSLVNYATGDRLEQLGALLGVARLPESKARTTIRLTRTSAATFSQLIPQNTRVAAQQSGPQLIWFSTIEDAIIPASQTSITVTAEAIAAGTAFNNYEPDTVNTLVDLLPNVTLTVANTTTTAGGLETELDEGLRKRIKLAPSQFSTAGSTASYKFYALSSDQSIVDVAVVSPSPIRVNVYPLTADGLPTEELKEKVLLAVNDERVRPLTDDTRVETPVERPYAIEANITLLAAADGQSLDNELQTAGEEWAAQKRASLGGDIVRSQIIAALQLPGVYSVDLISPAEDIILLDSDWPNATQVIVNVVGNAEG